jgi:hypothetical protein
MKKEKNNACGWTFSRMISEDLLLSRATNVVLTPEECQVCNMVCIHSSVH